MGCGVSALHPRTDANSLPSTAQGRSHHRDSAVLVVSPSFLNKDKSKVSITYGTLVEESALQGGEQERNAGEELAGAQDGRRASGEGSETTLDSARESEELRREVRSLVAFVPKLVVDWLLNTLTSGNKVEPSSHEVDVVCAFVDLSGFSKMASVLHGKGYGGEAFASLVRSPSNKASEGAERTRDKLNFYFNVVVDCIERSGGDVTKFVGDAVIAVWPNEPGAVQRVTSMCLAMADKIGELEKGDVSMEERLNVHIGIDVGKLEVTLFGAPKGGWFHTAFGLPILNASQLIEHAAPGRVVIARAAHENCPNSFEGTAVAENAIQVSHAREDDHHKASPANESFDAPVSRTRRVDEMLKLMEVALAKAPQRDNAIESFSGVDADLMRLNGWIRQFVPKPVLATSAALRSTDALCELRCITVLFLRLGVAGMDGGRVKVAEMQELGSLILREAFATEAFVKEFTLDDKGLVVVLGFGVPPNAHEDDALRGLRCALYLVQELGEMGCKAVAGVTTGDVFCGTVGAGRCEYALVGAVVNKAARLMTSCLKYGHAILVDEPTHDAVGQRPSAERKGIVLKEVPNLLLKGFEGTTAAFAADVSAIAPLLSQQSPRKMHASGRLTPDDDSQIIEGKLEVFEALPMACREDVIQRMGEIISELPPLTESWKDVRKRLIEYRSMAGQILDSKTAQLRLISTPSSSSKSLKAKSAGGHGESMMREDSFSAILQSDSPSSSTRSLMKTLHNHEDSFPSIEEVIRENDEQRKPPCCLIEGHSGMGKTLLLQKLIVVASRLRMHTIHVNFAARNKSSNPIAPWFHVLSSALSLVKSTEEMLLTAEEHRRLELLSVMGNMIVALTKVKSNILLGDASSAAALQRELLYATLTALGAASQVRPILCTIDGVAALSSEGFMMLVELIQAPLPRVCFVLAMRPMGQHNTSKTKFLRDTADRNGLWVQLRGVDTDGAHLIICDQLGAELVDRDVVDILHERSAGNPSSLQNWTLECHASGLLAVDKGTVKFTIPPSKLTAVITSPFIVRAKQIAALDVLDKDDANVLRTCSIAGVVSANALHRIMGSRDITPQVLAESLERLEDEGYLVQISAETDDPHVAVLSTLALHSEDDVEVRRRGEDARGHSFSKFYRFHAAITQQIVYEAVVQSVRTEIHTRFHELATIALSSGDATNESVAVGINATLLHHLMMSGRMDASIKYQQSLPEETYLNVLNWAETVASQWFERPTSHQDWSYARVILVPHLRGVGVLKQILLRRRIGMLKSVATFARVRANTGDFTGITPGVVS